MNLTILKNVYNEGFVLFILQVIAFDRGTSGMPGIFFSYEFSPIMVKFTEKPKYVMFIYFYIYI